MRNVLIADPNTPFATVVSEVLQNMGGYRVALAASGPEALQLCAEARPALAVVDVDLPDCDPAALVGRLRETAPGLPVIFIPYNREDVPPGLEVQAVLTKPFFLPDLPELINNILGAPVEPDEAIELGLEPEPYAKPVVIHDESRQLLEGHVQALSHAIRNEPVLLTQAENVLTICPHVSQTASAALASVVAKAWQTNGPGGEVIRFEGNSESTRYLLYSMRVAGDVRLSVAIRVRIPLPTVRRLLRDAAQELAKIVTE